jgi:hypothetical protein
VKARLAVVVVLGLLSAGCTADVLGRMKGFDVMQIIVSQPVAEAVMKARGIGRVLAGIEALILAFVCWYRIHTGAAWLSVTKDWFLGILTCAYILMTVGTAAGVERWIWDVGVYLGKQFTPGDGFLMESFNKAVAQQADAILILQTAPSTAPADQARLIEAVAWQLTMPRVALLISLNSMGIYIMKMIM